MQVRISEEWAKVMSEEFQKSYFVDLANFVREEYTTKRVFPPAKNIFRAFDSCHFDDIKVVIIGQDPYHGEGQANGLCFSVNDGVKPPPSLQNILREVRDDTGAVIPMSGDLGRWAKQGVLMLNSVLTVCAHEAASHAGMGWERFTDAVVKAITTRKEGVVYMLWGAYAQQKGSFINAEKNNILKSVHPSPLSAYKGFLGCQHFSQANKYLIERGETPIMW